MLLMPCLRNLHLTQGHKDFSNAPSRCFIVLNYIFKLAVLFELMLFFFNWLSFKNREAKGRKGDLT